MIKWPSTASHTEGPRRYYLTARRKMVRVTREALNEYFTNAGQNLGVSQMETEGAQVFQVPQGQNAPTTPQRKPATDAPRSRTGLAVLGAAVRAACNLYNATPGGFIDRYLDFSEYTSSESVADALMRQVCGAPPTGNPPGPPDPPPLAPSAPYSGGQCPGEEYEISYSITFGSDPNNPQTQQRTSSRTWIGPIGSISGPTPDAAGTAWTWTLRHDLDNPNGARTNVLASVGSLFTPSLSGISAVREDGQPDTCGDPPVAPTTDPTVPVPPDGLPPFSFDPGDGGPPETYEPDISIEPGPSGPSLRFRFPEGDYYVDPGGVDIVAPDAPDYCCPPNAVPPPAETVQPDPDEGPPPPTPPGEPEPDPDTEEEGRVIVAVVVTASNISTPSSRIGGTNGAPSVYAPRLGSLQFLIPFGDGSTAWTRDIDIKTPQQAVSVPFPQGAVDVRVFAYGGTVLSTRRYYAAPQSNLQG